MHHSSDNPHVAWIIIALQAVQLFKYISKDYWMTEVTAAESQKTAQVGRDLWCDQLVSQQSLKLVLQDQDVQCLIQPSFEDLWGWSPQTSGHLVPTFDCSNSERHWHTGDSPSHKCWVQGKNHSWLLTSLLLRKFSTRWAFLAARKYC